MVQDEPSCDARCLGDTGLMAAAQQPSHAKHDGELGFSPVLQQPAVGAGLLDPKTVQRLYRADDFDFRLKPSSAVVDRGMILHNVTDGLTGSIPDLGALEIGAAPPHYGPR